FATPSRATPTARQARSLAQCWNAWHDHGFGFQETKGSGAASCPGLAESSIYAHAVPEAKHRGLRAPGLRGVRRGADQVRGDAARAGGEERMMRAIQAVEFADGAPCDQAGQYLESFDPDANGGRGHATWTPDLSKAMRFANEALGMLWRQPTVRPLRPDGKPN